MAASVVWSTAEEEAQCGGWVGEQMCVCVWGVQDKDSPIQCMLDKAAEVDRRAQGGF